MNYFEIINAILTELDYQVVSDFSDLTKQEHKLVMSIINRLNNEICNKNDKFYFRQFIKEMDIYSDKIEYTLDINGKINKILGEKGEYSYITDYLKIYKDNSSKLVFSLYGDKILFPKNNDNLKIFYSTNEFVKDKSEELKSDFSLETDCSIIPDNYVERLFVNGVAFKFKQNSAHPKYLHWKQEYEKALSDLIAYAKVTGNSDYIIDGGFRKL